MSSLATSLLIFVCVFGGAMVGMYLRRVLPEHHLTPESREIVKLSIGLIATMTALVLGLLVGSVKSSHDSKSDTYNKLCSDIVLLDRVLAQYGGDTAPARGVIQAAVAARSKEIAERQSAYVTREDAYKTMLALEKLQALIRGLHSADETQRELRDRAIGVSQEIVQMRWNLLGGVASAVPSPFLVVVTIWLSIIFLSFGLYAPGNGTVLCALFLAALSVAGALFLVLEMDRPFDGLIRLSEKPLMHAAQFIGK